MLVGKGVLFGQVSPPSVLRQSAESPASQPCVAEPKLMAATVAS